MPSGDGAASLRPPSDRAKKDVPAKLACVVCGSGSYGNLCQACGGHVCPNHQAGAEEWCSLCEEDFADFKRRYRLPPGVLSVAGAVVLLSLLGSLASAWSSGNTGVSALLAPLLLAVVWAVILPIASKLWVKLRFMRDLKPRTAPATAINTSGQALNAGSEQQLMSDEGQAELPSVPSMIPEYDRTTLHTSVAPRIEPFAAGLSALLPPAEERNPVPPSQRSPVSDPPPSSRGPMVIRVELPNFPSMNPRAESMTPAADRQLSAAARRSQSPVPAEEPETPEEEDSRKISSVLPTAASVMPDVEVPPAAQPAGAREESAVDAPAVLPVPSSPAFEPRPIESSPHAEPPIAESRTRTSIPTPAPILIPIKPAPLPSERAPAVQKVLTLTADGMRETAAAPPAGDEQSGVRHALVRNEPGVLRDACSSVPQYRCS